MTLFRSPSAERLDDRIVGHYDRLRARSSRLAQRSAHAAIGHGASVAQRRRLSAEAHEAFLLVEFFGGDHFDSGGNPAECESPFCPMCGHDAEVDG